jgi:hypothetical protein
MPATVSDKSDYLWLLATPKVNGFSPVRSLALDYAIERGYLRQNPHAELRAAKLRASLELRRRRLSSNRSPREA